MKRALLVLCVSILPACGGGGGGGSTPPPNLPGLTTYTVGGAVSGLSGSGLVLTNNGLDSLTLNANGGFTFATAFPSGFPYDVAVKTQPSSPAQRCLVSNGTGTLNGANVTNVQVVCASTIGGTVAGVVGTVLLRDNGGDDLPISANGPFTFATGIATGNTYNVTATNPNQQCTVTNGTGTANGNVTNVQVVCKNTIGGTVTGLVGTVVLQDNAGDNLSVGALGPFTFATALDTGSSFSVTVFSQPVNQTCLVTGHPKGVAFGNVTDVQVGCVNGQWTWMNGASTGNQIGVYGTKGTAAASNVPGSRYGSVSWTETANGNLWLFGGFGYDNAPPIISLGQLNDLWKYNIASGQWTWVSGANVMDQHGTYGTKGTPAAANAPGSRESASSWIDAVSGNLWLFGGLGLGTTGGIPGNSTELNDLWRFNIGTGQWTWISGANVGQQPGVYGTKGTPAAANVPGSRQKAVRWFDGTGGNLWVFGGYGWSGVNLGDLNDLWKYNIASGQWTWVSGGNAPGLAGVYGTQGVAAATNAPGGRESAIGWIDGTSNLWLFGGNGWDSTGTSTATLNDLWKYNPGTNQWTWVSGSSQGGQSGVYGTLGVAANNTVPGSRRGAVSWIDATKNLWLFGGVSGPSIFNDVWKFDGSQWTWMNGSNVANQLGVYGTLGAAGTGVPGARELMVDWFDAGGNMWFFGGYDGSERNDLWRFK